MNDDRRLQPKFVGELKDWMQTEIATQPITYWIKDERTLYGKVGVIREAITLPNDNVLLGIQQLDEEMNPEPYLDYILLSDIILWRRLWDTDEVGQNYDYY